MSRFETGGVYKFTFRWGSLRIGEWGVFMTFCIFCIFQIKRAYFKIKSISAISNYFPIFFVFLAPFTSVISSANQSDYSYSQAEAPSVQPAVLDNGSDGFGATNTSGAAANSTVQGTSTNTAAGAAGGGQALADSATCSSALTAVGAESVSNSILVAAADLAACKAAVASCLSANNAASSGCLSVSPQLVALAPAVSAVASLAQLATDPPKMCKKGSELLTIISGGLAAFNAYCGVQQMSCSTACAAPLHAACATSAIKTITGAVASCSKSCGNFKLTLAAGAVGAVALLKTALTANKCSNALDCNQPANYTNPTCAANCSLAQNASSQACICQANPTAAGCSAYNAGTTSAGMGTVGGGVGSVGTLSNNSTAGLGALPGANPTPGPGNSQASGLAGADGGSKGGGGSGGGGGGTGAGAAGAQKAAGSEKGASDIYGGLLGGGGSAGRAGSGYDSAGGAGGGGFGGKYAKFLPTKAGVAGRGAASTGNELTGAGGKTNWEKVRSTYTDLNSTLLNSAH
jgi:hypothetical protein